MSDFVGLDFLLEKLKELKDTFEQALSTIEADKEEIKKEIELKRQYCDEYQVGRVLLSERERERKRE